MESKTKEEKLTADYLRTILHYDHVTGVFRWKKRIAHCLRVGDIAGTVTAWGYVCIVINKIVYRAHRLAFLYLTGKWPCGMVDHINHNKLDNSFANLRITNATGNGRNRKISINNKSGFTGVFFRKSKNRWVSQIKVGDKYIHLGHFDNIYAAIEARKKANVRYGFHKNHGQHVV